MGKTCIKVNTEIKLFSGSASQYLAEKIAHEYEKPLSKIDFEQFSDGEFQTVILESVRGASVFFVQSTFPPTDNLMELMMMMDAARRASASYIVAVIPYFGFARQDRKHRPRVSIGSKLVANILTTAGANRVITMDLHAPQIQGFFDIPLDHLDSSAVFIPYIKKLKLDDVVFAAPDMGSTSRVRTYAKYFKKDMVICDKYRQKANQIAHINLIGDVTDKDVIIIDDICDTANTLCMVAQKIMEEGAKSVRAFCTHPVLSGEAHAKIDQSALSELVVCDTIPMRKQSAKIKILSVAGLFATAIRNVHEHRSISSLFI